MDIKFNTSQRTDKYGNISKEDFIDQMVETFKSEKDFKSNINHNPRFVAETIFKAIAKGKNANKISAKEIENGDMKIVLILGFFAIDKDQSGSVDYAELKDIISEKDEKGAKLMFDMMDSNHDGKISIDEFLKFYFKYT
jgi:Ca2+-binding EF-hand superfamily protein